MNSPPMIRASADAPPVSETVDLRVEFRGRRGQPPVRAVDGVSLAVGQGETVGLIGESGSGKTTIGRAMIGLVKPSNGSVRFQDRDLWSLSRGERRRVCENVQAVFQDPLDALDPRMTVEASVAEPLQIVRGGPLRKYRGVVAEVLERVGLSDRHAKRLPHQLSGGQRQRVNIARALVLDPILIVCDEAVSALDVSIQADILNLFNDLQAERGLSYLFISHDLSVVGHVADRVDVMYLGTVIERGPVEVVLGHPGHPYTKALLAAQPELRSERRGRREVIQGEMPSPANPPSGCRFRTRCPFVQPRCQEEVPRLRALGDAHSVACHFAEQLQ